MSSQHFVINAQTRETSGRSASRCLRRQEKLPGIIYGAKKDPQTLTFDHNEILHALEHEAFYSSIIEIKIDGNNTQKAVIKDLQRHAYKPKLMHIDFLRVDENTEIHIHVPLHYVGTCTAVEEEGGVINHLMNEVEVVCLPKDLPEYIEVDISNLKLDETIHLSQLKIPAGVQLAELIHGNDAGVANVHIPRASKEDEAADAAEAAAATEAGEAAAAPAEGAAKAPTDAKPAAEEKK
jgi:large subunit ribosomal protein L25